LGKFFDVFLFEEEPACDVEARNLYLPEVEPDKCLMDFLAGDNLVGRARRARRRQYEMPSLPSFESDVSISSQYTKLKDKGQRLACGCIMSKEVGEYNTCSHLCHYCYANLNNVTALANWKRHCTCPHAETITGNTSVETRCA